MEVKAWHCDADACSKLPDSKREILPTAYGHHVLSEAQWTMWSVFVIE